LILDLVKSQAAMIRQLNDTVSDLKKTMETSHLKVNVKQELCETKEEMLRLRQEVKNHWRPTSGAWSKHNSNVFQGPPVLLGDLPSHSERKTLTPRPLTMLKPVVKNTMSFRTNSAEDLTVVYVEIFPSRFSRIRTDLHAAGIDTKKIIKISFINGRTAEFVVQTNYANVFKTIIGTELYVHDRFDASCPMDPNAPESVVLAFKKSLSKRIHNIIANSSMAIVRQLYVKMAHENGVLNSIGEKDSSFPEASAAVETNLSESPRNEKQEHGSGDSNSSTAPQVQNSITSEELRLLKVDLVQETPVENFSGDDYYQSAQTSTGKGKEPAIEIDLEDETGKSPKSKNKTLPVKKKNVETLMDEDLSEDTDVEIISKIPTSRKLRTLFQKLEYSCSSSNSTETNEDENMDLNQ
jgi:hypothetical protein